MPSGRLYRRRTSTDWLRFVVGVFVDWVFDCEREGRREGGSFCVWRRDCVREAARECSKGAGGSCGWVSSNLAR